MGTATRDYRDSLAYQRSIKPPFVSTVKAPGDRVLSNPLLAALPRRVRGEGE